MAFVRVFLVQHANFRHARQFLLRRYPALRST